MSYRLLDIKCTGEKEDCRLISTVVRPEPSVLASATSSSSSVASTTALLPKIKKKRNIYHPNKKDIMTQKEINILLTLPTSLDGPEKKIDDYNGNVPPLEKESLIKKYIKQLLAAFTVSLCSAVVGFASSYSAPAIVSLGEPGSRLNVTDDEASWIGSLMPLSALIGGILGGPFITYLGRKSTIMFIAVPFAISFATIGFANNIAMIMVGRALTGFCVGVASLSLPVYLGETLQPEVRGKFGLLPTTLGNFGILLAFMLGAVVDWSVLAFIGAFLPVPYFILMFFVPETPLWLMMKNKKAKAEQALVWLRTNKNDVSKELAELEKSQEAHNEEPITLKELVSKKYMWPLGISIGLMFFQQFSGINAVIFYTVTIFKESGSSIDSNLSSIIVGVVNLASTLAATFLIDRLGRKILMYISLAVMAVTLGVLGGYFYLVRVGYEMTQYGWLPLVTCVLYVVGFSFGSGPIPWLMMGEILPSKIRGTAASITTAFNWSCTFVVTKVFHDLKRNIGSDGTFWSFGVVCAIGLVFVALFVPETRGKRLDDIESHFRGEKVQIRNAKRHSSLANLNPLPSSII